MEHSHSYSGTTTFNKNHIHHYGGVTCKSTSGVPHVHSIKCITTFNLAHEHNYVTETGPPIQLPNGLHFHYFKTKVELVNEHVHYIYGNTSAD